MAPEADDLRSFAIIHLLAIKERNLMPLNAIWGKLAKAF